MESGVVRVAYKVLVDRREGLRGGGGLERKIEYLSNEPEIHIWCGAFGDRLFKFLPSFVKMMLELPKWVI